MVELNGKSVRPIVDEVLISVRPKHVCNLLNGTKKVELRKSKANLEPGSRLWIYSTRPTAQIEAVSELYRIEVGTPEDIWLTCGREAQVSFHEFSNYFEGCTCAYALHLRKVTLLEPKIGLEELRKAVVSFHPPRFFARISVDSPLKDLLIKSLPIS